MATLLPYGLLFPTELQKAGKMLVDTLTSTHKLNGCETVTIVEEGRETDEFETTLEEGF